MEQPTVVTIDRWSLYRGALISLRWPMDQSAVVSIDRWSLYRGALVSLRWPMDQSAVVSIDRWSLYRGALVSMRWPMDQSAVVSIDRWSFYASVFKTEFLYTVSDPIITLHACSDNMSDQCYICSDMVRCDCNKVKTFMHQKAHSQKWEHTLHYFHTSNCFDSFTQSPISMDETTH